MGRGINDIPGSIVSVDTAPSQAQNIPGISNHNLLQFQQFYHRISSSNNKTTARNSATDVEDPSRI
ncbi:hypothetical protein CVS40_9151 [Lucilia cuprina]|nr:hypothetical protein CVS40_9151 [Lucilia cuprina]